MAWYEAHQTLAKHPKTLKLASLLKVERRYAVGLLHDLFSWGIDAAKKDGSLPGLGAEEIASALDCSAKKGKAVIDALVESGYLESANGTYRIHDWYEYAGKLADQREADKIRKQKEKSKKLSAESQRNAQRKQTENRSNSSGNPTEIQRKSDGRNAEFQPLPYPTVPNPTNITGESVCDARARTREETEREELEPDRWEEFWKAYPRKSGGDIRTACMEYFSAIGAGAKPEDIIQGAKELAARTEPQNFRYLPSAEKWLRNKGWTEKVPEVGQQTNNPFLRKMIQESENKQ